MELKAGDVVCLKSDKDMLSMQRMVIADIQDKICYCVWMKDGEIKSTQLLTITLMHCDEAYRDTTVELV